MHILNSLMPVFLIIVLGKALTQTHFFSKDLAKSINLLTYWVALPALLIDKISSAVIESTAVWNITAVLIIGTLAGFAIGYLVAWMLRLPRRAIGAFVQGCGRANNAFIGLPVILYALANHSAQIESLATVALAPAIIFYNVSSVVILLLHGEKNHKGLRAAKMFAKQLLFNPILLGCVIGLLINYAGWTNPVMLQRTLNALGQAALPLALLCIGSSLSFEGLRSAALPSFAASVIKVFLLPLLGWFLCRAWGMPTIEMKITLIYLACPTAVATYVMTEILGSDEKLAGRIIVLSTLLSLISLSVVVAL